MQLHVKIDSFTSPDHMALRSDKFDVVDRPCMIGRDDDAVVLVKNGALELSYSPKFDHYWFSKCPSQDWFTWYYGSEWANPPPASSGARLKKAIKDFLRPTWRAAKRMLGLSNTLERFSTLDQDNYFTLLAPYAPKGAKILEAGCGMAELLIPFQRHGYDCYGIEPAEVWARVARRRGVKMLVSTIQDTPEIREMFRNADVVLSNHSMEHHWDPRILLSIARDNMKPGSMLSITVPNGEACFWLMQNLFLLHLDAYTMRSLEAMLAAYGFRCVFKSSNVQLRFLAVRDPDLTPPPPAPAVSAVECRARFADRFARQLGLKPQDGADVEFSVAFKGARPFFDTDYQLFTPAEAVPGARTLAGHVRASRATDAAIVYEAAGGASTTLLK